MRNLSKTIILLLAFLHISISTFAQAGGAEDQAFFPVGGDYTTGSGLTCSLPLPDGKVIIGGSFLNYGNRGQNYIARLNADGTIDETFSTGVGFDRSIEALALQSDGKILVGGRFSAYGSSSRSRLARLNPDGSLDAEFNRAFSSTVWCIKKWKDSSRQ